MTTTTSATVAFATTMAASSAVVSALDSGLMFAAGFMASVSYMALAVAGFVSVEVIEWLLAMFWHGANVAVSWIVAIVDVAVEAVMAVIPRTSSNE